MGLKVEPKTVYSELKNSEAMAVDGLFEDFLVNGGYSEVADEKKAEIYAAWVAAQSGGDVTAGELRDGMYAYLDSNSEFGTLAESVYVAATDYFGLDKNTDFYKECRRRAFPTGLYKDPDDVLDVSEMSFVPEAAGNVFNLKKTLLVIAAVALLLLILKKK